MTFRLGVVAPRVSTNVKLITVFQFSVEVSWLKVFRKDPLNQEKHFQIKEHLQHLKIEFGQGRVWTPYRRHGRKGKD